MTTRVNISVPDDVKRRMESFPGVNWSAVAVRAFRRHMGEEPAPTLAELAKEVCELRNAVARLVAGE
jgi:hypothetical protein